MYRVETNKGVFHARHVAKDMQTTVEYYVERGYIVLHIESY